MKIPYAILAALCFLLSSTQAQTVTSPPIAGSQPVTADTPWAITLRGANQRVWQKTTYEKLPSGKIVPHVQQYTELATGMHYWQNGQWVESKEQINILPNGTAAATQGRHQAYFPGDIGQGNIELVTPEGRILQSQPLGLSYDDGSNTVFIALLTNSVGEVAGSNQVIYPNAFDGVSASLRYTYISPRMSGTPPVMCCMKPTPTRRYCNSPTIPRMNC